MLSAVQGKQIVWMGLLCSSFTRINVGTSKRSYLVPLGNTAAKSVAESNCLAARTGRDWGSEIHVVKMYNVGLPTLYC